MTALNPPEPDVSTPAAPYCAPFDPHPRKPRVALPKHACDCHAHICGPAADHPYAPDRIYTPHDSLLTDYLHMLATVGVERCVLVQPSVYGSDNTVLLRAMEESPLPCRGVAVIEPSISDAEITRLHEAGIRGIRFNLVDVHDPTGAIPLDDVEAVARRVKPLGWHAEFLIHADNYPNIDAMFADFPTDIVLGHMGYMRPPLAVDAACFQGLLRLAKGGRCWVKMSGPARISAGEMPHPDAVPIARALIETAPDRLIWGSDWPHVKLSQAIPNDGDLVDLIAAWIPDPALRRQVLVDNPNVLYRFTR
jgi:2-pyrone-4,6-dicarboxylate lactonase